MDSNTNLLNNDMLKFLKTYNFIKNNDVLKGLCEKIEELERTTRDEDKINTFNFLNGIIQSEASDILGFCFVKNSIRSELSISPFTNKKKIVRIYMDGVFDIIHSGHFNAIRQSKKLGDILVVGVNSSEEVQKIKGPLIMDDRERAALVRACKWVDEVIENTPYSPTIELLDEHNIDYCAHGDDIAINTDGESCYSKIEKAGRFKVFKRTEGISTTDIIGRLLLVGKEIYKTKVDMNPNEYLTANTIGTKMTSLENFELGPVMSKFLTTGWRLAEFSNNRSPKMNDRVVFIDGAFDILHIGHIETLRKAREMGDFLYVGLHDDKTVNVNRGKNYPILSLQERIFNLLAIKYVDDVVIASPWTINADMITGLKIDLVVEGTTTKMDPEKILDRENDPYKVPKEMGIYRQIESDYSLDNEIIVKRLLDRREHFIKKYSNKKAMENEYYSGKSYVPEI